MSTPNRKTASELLAILDAEAKNFWAVALVLRLPDRDVLIAASDGTRGAQLADIVAKGGTALGLVAVERKGKLGKACSRPFPEFEHNDRVCEYLRGMRKVFASYFAAPGVRAGLRFELE